jgi:Ca-activated chloride channel family protein
MRTSAKAISHLLLLNGLAVCSSLVFPQELRSPNQIANDPAVKLSLIVTDRSNHSVDDVSRDEVQVLEDKVPQTLSLFSKDERPVNYVVAIDRSGSFKDVLSPALDAVRSIINGKKDQDEIQLISFVSSDKIETVHEFTSDKSKLIDSLKQLKIAMGQSAVNDAIYIAVKTAANYKPGDSVRRAVVLVSDGEERNSYYSSDALVELLRTTDVQVFIIGIVNQLDSERGLIRKSPRQSAEELLNRVASESGGRVFMLENRSDLSRAATEINHDLRSQYIIGYQPTTNDSKKNFRKVEVRIIPSAGREKLKAIARPGYLVSRPKLDVKEKKKSK